MFNGKGGHLKERFGVARRSILKNWIPDIIVGHALLITRPPWPQKIRDDDAWEALLFVILENMRPPNVLRAMISTRIFIEDPLLAILRVAAQNYSLKSVSANE